MAEIKTVLYLCDRRACKKCDLECRHTRDILHAENFELIDSSFWETNQPKKPTKQKAPIIDSLEAAAKELEFIKDKMQEYFVLLTLNGARRLIKTHTITIGTLTSTLVHPREIFALAIEDRAASIIVGHNHPSGVLAISNQDREVSKRIKEVGELIGIYLDDHVVISEDSFASAM